MPPGTPSTLRYSPPRSCSTKIQTQLYASTSYTTPTHAPLTRHFSRLFISIKFFLVQEGIALQRRYACTCMWLLTGSTILLVTVTDQGYVFMLIHSELSFQIFGNEMIKKRTSKYKTKDCMAAAHFMSLHTHTHTHTYIHMSFHKLRNVMASMVGVQLCA
jgi:hypothetical protein